MSAVELTVALTAHGESIVAGPTMRSVEIACRRAEEAGIGVERAIVLDAPSNACRAFFTQPRFADWRILEVEARELGLARNRMVELAQGSMIAFIDADDLFSENWLVEGVRRLREADAAGERVIAHPELNWLFDRVTNAFVKVAQDDVLFTPYLFYFQNYYDSLCVAPTRALREIPYRPRSVADGFWQEDWQFNVDSMALGWRHVVVQDTIVFKRRRDQSMLTDLSGGNYVIRSTEAMAIDRISELPYTTPEVATAAARSLPRLPLRRRLAWLAKGRRDLVREYETLRGSAEFDPHYYLERYVDVRSSGLNPLVHYLQYGRAEGRRPARPEQRHRRA